MKELESLYDTVINEGSDPTVVGNGADDALGHSKLADEIDDKTGPNAVENIDEPVKQEDNSLKLPPKEINTGMNDKTNVNVFDRLYSTIMEDGEEFDMGELEAGLEGEPEMGEEPSGEVTLTISSDQADALRGLLSQLEEPAGDDIEDLDAMDGEGFDDGMGEEGGFREAVDADHTSQGSQPGQDPTGLGPNKKNTVPGDASKTSSGGATGKVMDKVGNDGDLKDTTSHMTATGSRSNVVAGRVSGNNQNAFS